jgi:hypothetical protein
VAPEVDALVAKAARDADAEKRAPLTVGADVDRAQVAIDGRAPSCATPCVVELLPGRHIVGVEADAVAPESRVVHLDAAGAKVDVKTTPAPPELAERQWVTRYAAQPAALDSAASMRLLARANRARRFALVEVDGAPTARLRGVLSVDEGIAARAERSGPLASIGAETHGLLRDLLVKARVVEPAARLYTRPLFWLTVAVVGAGAAIGTYFLVRPTPTRTVVTF